MRKTLHQAVGRAVAKKSNGAAHSRASAFLTAFTNAPTSRFSGVKDFCETYAVSQDTFSRLVGFSPRAIANWAQGRKPSASTERRLSELTRLFGRLEKLVEPAAIGPWLYRKWRAGATRQRAREIGVNFLPVWDGMVAAKESLYLATRDGRVVCMR